MMNGGRVYSSITKGYGGESQDVKRAKTSSASTGVLGGSSLQNGRSEKAQGLHRLIMAACRAENELVLKHCLSEIAKYIDHNSSNILLELSVSNDSHLDDAMHLPFEIQKNDRRKSIRRR